MWGARAINATMPAHREHRIGRANKQRVRLRRLGASVKAARIALGLSQGGVASAVGCSPQTVGNIESGTYWPSLPVALLLREKLWISIDEVVR